MELGEDGVRVDEALGFGLELLAVAFLMFFGFHGGILLGLGYQNGCSRSRGE